MLQGKIRAIKRWPYLAHVICMLKMRPKEGVERMCVNQGGVVYYNPLMEEEDPDTLGMLIAHEAWHIVRDHFARQKWRDVRRWNLACDLAINDDLGAPFPGVLPAQFGLPRGRAEEWYYDALEDGQETEIHFQWEDGQDPIPPQILKGLQQEVARGVLAGNCPGGLKRWARAVLGEEEPEERLFRMVWAALYGQKSDISYRKPSRRDWGDLILPGWVKEKPTLAVVVDTSGSIEPELLDRFVGIVQRLAQHCDLTIYVGDATLEWKGKDPSKMELIGGGGTNMGAILEKVTEEVALVLTDGETPWGSPRRNTYALIYGHRNPPSWVKAIKVDL